MNTPARLERSPQIPRASRRGNRMSRRLARAAAIGVLLPALSCSSNEASVAPTSTTRIERSEQPGDFYSSSTTHATAVSEPVEVKKEKLPEPQPFQRIDPSEMPVVELEDRYARVARFTGRSSSGDVLEGHIGMMAPVPASNFAEAKSHCSGLDEGTPLGLEFSVNYTVTSDAPVEVTWSAPDAFRRGEDRIVYKDVMGDDSYRCTSQYTIDTRTVTPGKEVNIYGVYFMNDAASSEYPQGKPNVLGGTVMHLEFAPFNTLELSGSAAVGCGVAEELTSVDDLRLNAVLFAGDAENVPGYFEERYGAEYACRSGE